VRIGIVAAARFPIAEPFAGGLEAHVWGLAERLRRRGHDVTLFAGPGSDPRLGVECLDLRRPQVSAAARADVSMCAPCWVTTVDPCGAPSMRPTVLAIVHVGKTSASSLPRSCAIAASSLRCHGSSRRPKQREPTAARAASCIAAVSCARKSLRRSMAREFCMSH